MVRPSKVGEHDWNAILSGKSVLALSLAFLFDLVLMIKSIWSRFTRALVPGVTGPATARRFVLSTVICPTLDNIIILSSSVVEESSGTNTGAKKRRAESDI